MTVSGIEKAQVFVEDVEQHLAGADAPLGLVSGLQHDCLHSA